MSNPDWNFEPLDNECDICGQEECECTDRHERDTLDE